MVRTGLLTLIALLLLATARQGAAAGDPEIGEQVYRQCAACHALAPGVHRTGPSLAGMFGREAGTAEGFHRYSDALRSADLVWREDTLNGFLADPHAELGLQALPIYVDQSGKAQHALSALGIPTTLLLDREGNEVGRLLGPAEWDSPEMVDFLRGRIQQPPGASVRPASHEQLASNEVRRVTSLSEPLPSSHWKELPYAQ